MSAFQYPATMLSSRGWSVWRRLTLFSDAGTQRIVGGPQGDDKGCLRNGQFNFERDVHSLCNRGDVVCRFILDILLDVLRRHVDEYREAFLIALHGCHPLLYQTLKGASFSRT